MKKLLCVLVIIVMVAAMVFAGCTPAETSQDAQDEGQAAADDQAADDQDDQAADDQEDQAADETQKKWKIALSNSFVGNDWRQEMQLVAEYVANSDAYKDKVELTIVNCENTAEAQSASIDALILEDYDAILIDAASATALNQAIERAVGQGIVVVSFDQLVDSSDVYLIGADFGKAAQYQARYLAEAIGGEGKIVVDRGLPGAKGSGPLYEDAVAVFEEYPGIEIIHEFDGNFAEGETLAGMNAAIAANPQIDAVYTQGYVAPVIKALKEADRPLVPVSGWSYNSSFLALAENDCDGILAHNSPAVGASAMNIALEVLEGSTEYTLGETIDYPLGWYAMNPDTYDFEEIIEQIELGVNALSEMAPGFMIPTTPGLDVEVPNEAVITE